MARHNFTGNAPPIRSRRNVELSKFMRGTEGAENLHTLCCVDIESDSHRAGRDQPTRTFRPNAAGGTGDNNNFASEICDSQFISTLY